MFLVLISFLVTGSTHDIKLNYRKEWLLQRVTRGLLSWTRTSPIILQKLEPPFQEYVLYSVIINWFLYVRIMLWLFYLFIGVVFN